MLSRRDMMLALAATGLPLAARAQPAWPTRPVQMIVPFPPGGQADVTARPVAAALERVFGQAVPVVNRAGAGGILGTASVARAAPDGYTALINSSHPTIPAIVARVPYQTVDDFVNSSEATRKSIMPDTSEKEQQNVVAVANKWPNLELVDAALQGQSLLDESSDC